jgi:hypothetical protein
MQGYLFGKPKPFADALPDLAVMPMPAVEHHEKPDDTQDRENA